MKLICATLLALCFVTGARAAEPRILLLDLAAPFIEGRIAGQDVKLRVDPAASAYVEVDRSTVRRLRLLRTGRILASLAGLRKGGLMMHQIGRARLSGGWLNEKLTVGGETRDVRVSWTENDEDDGADGVISPALLPYDEVRLTRRGVSTADRMVVVPVRLGQVNGLWGKTSASGREIDVEFAPFKARTVATAAAGAFISQANGGTLSGSPERVVIAYGVDRPVRAIKLTRPFAVVGFSLPGFLVRVADWRGENILPQDEESSSDEIVVVGRISRQRPWAKLVLGADMLDRCATISYRRALEQIQLTCDFDSAAN